MLQLAPLDFQGFPVTLGESMRHGCDMGGETMGALPYLAILTSLIAAVLGIRAATIHVRDSMDNFIADLQKARSLGRLGSLRRCRVRCASGS
jgi:hypothetical protein